MFPIEISQAHSHRCAATAFARYDIVENLAGRHKAEVSEHHGERSISPMLLFLIENDKRLSHVTLGLQTVMRMHPESAVLHQRIVNALAVARRNRWLRDKGNAIHGVGKNQPMPMHSCWHRQLIDQLKIDAFIL